MRGCHINSYRGLFLGLIIWASPSLADESSFKPQRILFIGNSYTEYMRPCLTQMVNNSPWKQTHLEFITHSGMRLAQHLANTHTVDKIHSGQWDRVILQEYSRLPALQGAPVESFQMSVSKFSQEIRNAVAKPLLYMTWGRRDGDAENRKVLPDFKTMQQQVTTSYETAAEQNQAGIVPVGLVWSWIHDKDSVFGEELYAADGSHPSPKGSCLAAAVFLHNLFADDLTIERRPAVLNLQEWEMIRLAVAEVEHSLSP